MFYMGFNVAFSDVDGAIRFHIRELDLHSDIYYGDIVSAKQAAVAAIDSMRDIIRFRLHLISN